jgi:hypothetical protein
MARRRRCKPTTNALIGRGLSMTMPSFPGPDRRGAVGGEKVRRTVDLG